MPAATCGESVAGLSRTLLPVKDYDLAATLSSGQAFRWQFDDGAWEGVVGHRWVRLRQLDATVISAEATAPTADWSWLKTYLQTAVDLDAILGALPQDDAPLRASVAACRGLRLLRQDPWECLASFICSSTKQIVQIQQIVSLLCARFGQPVIVPAERAGAFAFPSAERLAGLSEAELRACKMGFRAPSLLAAARQVAAGEVNLDALAQRSLAEARFELQRLPGVGEKIANCVLLFAYDFPQAFPVDVWVLRAMRELYFPRRTPQPARLRRFIDAHFGHHAGYAQQYLFHYMRAARHRRPAG